MKRPGYGKKTFRRRQESGFALLMIFLMASAVALMLYMQVPRQAFESERDKEQMLIDRGEQYKRAVYLYYVSNNHQWPSKIEDLENTNSHRYLRQRYVDPYTGKDEWRLIHTNGAYLTDSLVTPPPAQGSPGVQGGALAGSGAPTTQGFQSPGFTLTQPSTGQPGATAPNAPPAVNDQVARRASDNTMVTTASYQNIAGNAPGQNNNGNNGTNGDSYQPFNAATLPPISLYPNGYNAPAANVPGAVGVNGQPSQAGQPGVNQPGANPLNPLNQQPGLNPTGLNPTGLNPTGANPINLPGTNFPMTNPGFTAPSPTATAGGFGSTPGQLTPVASQNQGFNPGGAAPGQAMQAIPGAGPTSASSQAINLINQLLTQPRQQPTGLGPNQQPAAGGGGLAGVASTHKGTTIKSYLDHTKYQEWEFVFQINQQGSGIQTQPGQGPNGSGGIPTTGVLGTPGAAGGTGATGTGAPGTAPGGGAAPAATGAAAGTQPSSFFTTNQ